MRIQWRMLFQIDLQVRLDGAVAAADVEPDPDHAHLILVGRHSTNGHDEAAMTVGHQGGEARPLANLMKLFEGRLVVLSENRRHVHECLPIPTQFAWSAILLKLR